MERTIYPPQETEYLIHLMPKKYQFTVFQIFAAMGVRQAIYFYKKTSWIPSKSKKTFQNWREQFSETNQITNESSCP